MAAVRADRLASVISCTAASSSGALLAVCPGTHEVILYERGGGGGWQEVERLPGHEATVAGLQFLGDQQLVSASHDRNSYVWTRQPGGGGDAGPRWRHEMVITKLTRAGLCVDWAPAGAKKFAVGSSEKVVCVCYWDAERELWAPRLIRKQHQSSVMALAFHPCGVLLATASTDGICRLFNAAVPGVDSPKDTPAALSSSRFGDCLLQLQLPGGWGLAAAWSLAGDTLAVASLGSQLTLLRGLDVRDPGALMPAAAEGNSSGQQQSWQHLQLPGLPLKCLAFLSNTLLVGGGFDCVPLLFRRHEGGDWQFDRCLKGLQAGSSAAAGKAGSLSARIQAFELAAAKAAGAKEERNRSGGGSSEGPHENCIVSITPLPAAGSSSTSSSLGFLTAGLDGRVVEWQVEEGCLLTAE